MLSRLPLVQVLKLTSPAALFRQRFRTTVRELLADRFGERKDFCQAEQVSDQQDQKHQHDSAKNRSAGVGADGQLVDRCVVDSANIAKLLGNDYVWSQVAQ